MSHSPQVSGLADKPEPVAAARPRPAALVVPDVPAEADAPGQTVLLVTLLQPQLGPAEAVHLYKIYYQSKSKLSFIFGISLWWII